MPDQVNAWGNYDTVARSARAISTRKPTNALYQRRRSSIREIGMEMVAEIAGGSQEFTTSAAGGGKQQQRSASAAVTKSKDWADYFDPAIAESVANLDYDHDDKDEAVDAPKKKKERFMLLSEEIRRDICDIFSVYFEGQNVTKKKKAFSVVSFIDATMPSSQPFLESVFFGFYRQIALFIELSLRGISQVYFQNNPLSGLLILIGLFIQSPRVALYGLLALVSGNVTVYILKFDMGLARSGLFGYNALLVGLAIATFSSGYSLGTAIFSVLISVLSSILLVTLGKLLNPYKSPPLTLPFNVATMIFLLATAHMARVSTGPVVTPSLPVYSNTADAALSATAAQLFGGTIRGLGQVFLANHLAAGILVFVGIAVSSRIAAVTALVGSFLGAGIALATGVDPTVVEAGLYSYNASLSFTALYTFYSPSIGAGVLALLAACFTVTCQQALATMLEPVGLPVLTLPFCLVALPFILIQGTTSIVIAVPLAQLTVPEDHLKRVKTLEEGIQFLKESLHPEEEQQGRHNRKMAKTISRIDSAITDSSNRSFKSSHSEKGGNIDKNKEKSSPFFWKRENAKDVWAREQSSKIFKAILKASKSDSQDLNLTFFQTALMVSGLTDRSGLRFASLVFNLLDLDLSQSIDEMEFMALCLVSIAVYDIRRKISQFMLFVDLNHNGWIDFDEIDSALEYLGQPTLEQDEMDSLARMTGCHDNDDNDGEMEVVELINLMTVLKIKGMVAAYQSGTDGTGSVTHHNEGKVAIDEETGGVVTAE